MNELKQNHWDRVWRVWDAPGSEGTLHLMTRLEPVTTEIIDGYRLLSAYEGGVLRGLTRGLIPHG